jgi:hypothetical protein
MNGFGASWKIDNENKWWEAPLFLHEVHAFDDVSFS